MCLVSTAKRKVLEPCEQRALEGISTKLLNDNSLNSHAIALRGLELIYASVRCPRSMFIVLVSDP